MQRLDLVRFLADSASELLDPATLTDANQSARLDEASELMNLGARILARNEGEVSIKAIQEAA